MTNGVDLSAPSSVDPNVAVEVVITGKTIGNETQKFWFSKNFAQLSAPVLWEQSKNRRGGFVAVQDPLLMIDRNDARGD